MAPRFSLLSGGTRALLCGGLVVPVLLALGGCESLNQIAPPVASIAPGTAATTQLERGRELYITACAKCHSPEPVLDYTESEWLGKILPEMCRLTKLDSADSDAVRAYVLAVHRSAMVTR
ncbi:MAG: hypothetical protein ACKO2G_05885 [Verrucomicrobiales bacterium]